MSLFQEDACLVGFAWGKMLFKGIEESVEACRHRMSEWCNLLSANPSLFVGGR